MKVAVTGVGGGVGQSILKALTLSTLPVEVLAIDIQPLSAGLYRADDAVILPGLETGTEDEWRQVLQDRNVDALIPGSDHDLVPIATVRERWAEDGVCAALVSDLEVVAACRDKALTCELLESKGVPVPTSAWDLDLDAAASWARSQGYPIVLKPRDGSASRHFQVVKDEEELRFFYQRTPNPILQEYLSLSGQVEEYTCSVFADGDGKVAGTFMARRELSGGSTYRAEIGHWPEIQELLISIGTALRPRGSINVQLRMTERGPVPFELNPRCSGTTGIRAYFGFNEPEMLLRHYVLGEPLEAPQPRFGYVMRYWNEVFLEGPPRGLVDGNAVGSRGEIVAWP
jgi:carbamoyl-phosphate synthase large subunit